MPVTWREIADANLRVHHPLEGLPARLSDGVSYASDPINPTPPG